MAVVCNGDTAFGCAWPLLMAEFSAQLFELLLFEFLLGQRRFRYAHALWRIGYNGGFAASIVQELSYFGFG